MHIGYWWIMEKFTRDNAPWMVTLFLLIFIWHFTTRFFNVPTYILPNPVDVIEELIRKFPSLMYHGGITLSEILIGFFCGMSIAFLLSIGILYSRTVERVVYPFLIFLQVVPKIALAPLFLIWFGYGQMPKIAVSAIMCFFPIIVNTVRGLKSVDNELLDLTDSLNATKLQVFLKIRLPSSMPFVFAGLRIAITLSVIGAVVGEFIGADKGLGYLIMLSNVDLETTRMFATLLVLSCMGITLFLSVCGIERLFLAHWPAQAKVKTI